MYKIEKKEYGFRLTFGGVISANEMFKWVNESQTTLSDAPNKFGIFVDMRDLKPLTPDAAGVMQEGQKLYKDKGMERSVVILSNSMVTMQFKRIAKDSGIYKWERYIDASAIPGWETAGEEWIRNGIDPDRK
jgi:hypothetical protein